MDQCSATSIVESSRRDLLNDMSEHKSILKNYQNSTYYPRYMFTPKTYSCFGFTRMLMLWGLGRSPADDKVKSYCRYRSPADEKVNSCLWNRFQVIGRIRLCCLVSSAGEKPCCQGRSRVCYISCVYFDWSLSDWIRACWQIEVMSPEYISRWRQD